MLGRRLHRRHGHSGLRAFRTDWARRFARQADGWHFGCRRTAMSIFTSNTMTRKHMTRKHMTRKHVLAGCALAILAYGACTLGPAIGAETVPNFAPDSNVGWVASGKGFGVDFVQPASGPGPVTNDPAYPYLTNAEAARTGRRPP